MTALEIARAVALHGHEVLKAFYVLLEMGNTQPTPVQLKELHDSISKTMDQRYAEARQRLGIIHPHEPDTLH
jgi:hypothetical protein